MITCVAVVVADDSMGYAAKLKSEMLRYAASLSRTPRYRRNRQTLGPTRSLACSVCAVALIRAYPALSLCKAARPLCSAWVFVRCVGFVCTSVCLASIYLCRLWAVALVVCRAWLLRFGAACLKERNSELNRTCQTYVGKRHASNKL